MKSIQRSSRCQYGWVTSPSAPLSGVKAVGSFWVGWKVLAISCAEGLSIVALKSPQTIRYGTSSRVAIFFVCDHVEVLYDLDIEAKKIAQDLGMRFVRTSCPNDHPTFIRMIADIVEATVRNKKLPVGQA